MMINPILRIVNYVIYGGSWNLREYEARVIEEVKCKMTDADALAVAEQIKKLDHVKRLHSDKIVTFYFQRKNYLPRLSNIETEFCVGCFHLSGNKIKCKVNVYSHLGLLSSMEFSKTPKKLNGALMKISPAKYCGSIVTNIEAEEH